MIEQHTNNENSTINGTLKKGSDEKFSLFLSFIFFQRDFCFGFSLSQCRNTLKCIIYRHSSFIYSMQVLGFPSSGTGKHFTLKKIIYQINNKLLRPYYARDLPLFKTFTPHIPKVSEMKCKNSVFLSMAKGKHFL